MMLCWFQRLWLKKTWLLLLFNFCEPWATIWGQQSWKGHLASKGPWDNKTIWYKRKKKKKKTKGERNRKTERPLPRGTPSWMWPIEWPPAKPAEMFKWDQPGNLGKQNCDQKKKKKGVFGFRVVCYIVINYQNNVYLVPCIFFIVSAKPREKECSYNHTSLYCTSQVLGFFFNHWKTRTSTRKKIKPHFIVVSGTKPTISPNCVTIIPNTHTIPVVNFIYFSSHPTSPYPIPSPNPNWDYKGNK